MPDADSTPTASSATASSTADALELVRTEVDRAVRAVVETDPDGLDAVADLVSGAERVFVHGAGRSGLALRMTAMRLMHLGLTVHVVGEVTSPAIGEGDVLLTASGSGTTSGIVSAAQSAVDAGARVAAVTTAADSPLAGVATAVVLVPAAEKLDRRAPPRPSTPAASSSRSSCSRRRAVPRPVAALRPERRRHVAPPRQPRVADGCSTRTSHPERRSTT